MIHRKIPEDNGAMTAKLRRAKKEYPSKCVRYLESRKTFPNMRAFLDITTRKIQATQNKNDEPL